MSENQVIEEQRVEQQTVENQKQKRSLGLLIYGVLKDDVFVGITALTLLGGLSIYYGQMEIAGVAVGGIAGMLKRKGGED